ncbi:hypothetical protein QBC39DRAFT_163954 [Podospora conica]|nr:hypothetical protein QBC39DRAFT_163954 [Schizothecium conicum]
MSLNGLDDAKVKEAHDAAVAEAGGWFLLKYASRDELELLGRGTGGIAEVRNAVAQYEDTSPLYGFLRYRRRNVIIKYLPEDCSRLIQARATVHFNSICEFFSPYDTALSISDAKELRDTKLSAACSLHAASGSTSSSTSSLRRRRLVEIEEEEEEEERDRKRQSVVKEEDASNLPDGGKQVETSTPAEKPVTLNADLASSPEASRFVDETEVPRFTGVARPPSPEVCYDESGRRLSSQSARPDLYGSSGYPYGKPRVKLAPRPSADIAGRPRTSAGGGTFRPVSALPAGLKLSKPPKKGRQEGDDFLESPIKEEMETPFSTNAPSSPGPKTLDTEPARPHTSSGASILLSRTPSFRANLPAMLPPASKQNTMTPEKQRLLKAMKLREKKKMMSSQPTSGLASLEVPTSPVSPTAPDQPAETETVAEDEEAEGSNAGLQISLDSLSKADSSFGFDSITDQGSFDARTDSHPASPFAPSDAGSTQASSLSESTDETIQVAEKPSSPPPTNDDDSDADNASSASEKASPLPPADDSAIEREVPSLSERPSSPKMEVVSKLVEDKASEDEAHGEVAESEPALETAQIEEPTVPNALPISKFSLSSAPATTPPAEAEDQPIVAEFTAEPEELPDLEEESPALPTAEADRPSQIHIPVSKFSTHESKSPTSPPSATIPTIVCPEPEGQGVPPSAATEEAAAEDAPLNAMRPKQRAPLEPLKIGPNAEKDRYSAASLTDDGKLMELQTATVEQAKPIIVLKSPSLQTKNSMGKLAAPGSESGSSTPRIVRTVSNPIRGPAMVLPGDVSTSSARAVSSGAAYLHKITQQQSSSELRPKSSKLGSSISQRIKALEKLSSTTGGSVEPAPKEKPAASFFAVRRTAGREPSRSPSVADRANSLTRVTTPSPPESGESSPESTKGSLRDRKGSMVSRLSVFEGGKPPRGRPESIQVTARIIRDPAHLFPKAPELKADPTDYQPLDLKQSPLLVNVQKRTPSPNPPPQPTAAPIQEAQPEVKQSLLQRRFSKGRRSESHDRNNDAASDADTVYDGPRPRRRSSLTVVKDFIKDRRESLLAARSPSTDSLGLSIASGLGGLASPAMPTGSSKSPSRPPSVHQTNIFTRRLSMGSRRSSMEQTAPPAALSSTNLATAGLSPSPRITEGSVDSDADRRSITGYGDKMSGSVSGGSAPGSATTSPPPGKNNTNRASRFMRRLSNSLTSNRKNITPSISPTVAEEEDAEVAAAADMGAAQSRGSTATGAPTIAQPTIVSYMGDVNVQFPDNLLWKRRSICLDSQGFLILSAVQGGAASVSLGKTGHHQAGTIKRYHMSDFRLPYTPEMEVQELPNSVVLDFVDGSGLQVACEDRAGQMNMLQVLQEAHHSHTSFGQ